MRCVLALIVTAACSGGGHPAAPRAAPPVSTADACERGLRVLDAASNARPDGDSVAYVVDDCGCGALVRTGAVRAFALRSTYERWQARGCEPFICDRICEPIVPMPQSAALTRWQLGLEPRRP